MKANMVIQKFNFSNILAFIFISQNNFYEVLKKIFIRFFDLKSFLYKEKNLKLLKKNAVEMNTFLQNLNKNLKAETLKVAKIITKEGNKKIKKVPYNLGGAANLPLLYFLTRYYKPKNILETGVAAGYSSYTFLEAIKKNKKGILYSSDLPYFRIKNPKKYIGIVVPQKLKKKWKLYLDGDAKNLNNIKKITRSFELIHYDSDKSYIGRYLFFKSIKKMIRKNTIIIMDDLHNNIFFFDYIKKNKIENYKIIKSESKFVGIILPTLG